LLQHIIIANFENPARLELLVHILCELKESRGVTADNLRRACQGVRYQIKPTKLLRILDEIHLVRKVEERYIDGEIGKSSHLAA
jgi:hypothetical protein